MLEGKPKRLSFVFQLSDPIPASRMSARRSNDSGEKSIALEIETVGNDYGRKGLATASRDIKVIPVSPLRDAASVLLVKNRATKTLETTQGSQRNRC